MGEIVDTLIGCRRLGILMSALALIVFLCAGDAEASDRPTEGAAEQGNIVIVLIDDVGVDYFSVYGARPGQPHTPNINSFAKEGAVFRAAYSQPSCTPTRASIMTGQYGRRSGHGVLIRVRGDDDEIPLDAIFIPEMLAGAAKPYASSAVGKWHMASIGSPSGFRHPLLQGFGWYAGAYGNIPREESYRRFLKTVNGAAPVMTSRYATSDTVDDAILRMNAMQPPWYLNVAFNAAHYSYEAAPAPLRTRDVNANSRKAAKFKSMVEAIDHEFGRLIAGIPANQARQTTVFLLSDNGTAPGVIQPPFESERSKSTVYEGGIHVPLIVKGPTVVAPEIDRDQLVHVVDLFPTIAELAGVQLEHEIDGVSFAPALREAKAEGRSLVYADRFFPNGPPPYKTDERTVRNRDWKLIRRSWMGERPDDLEEEEFFAMKPGQIDEGPNLLRKPLRPEAKAAYQSLVAALNRISANLTYEGAASGPEEPKPPSSAQ
jgi:arylsulfatase A-like enzyme